MLGINCLHAARLLLRTRGSLYRLAAASKQLFLWRVPTDILMAGCFDLDTWCKDNLLKDSTAAKLKSQDLDTLEILTEIPEAAFVSLDLSAGESWKLSKATRRLRSGDGGHDGDEKPEVKSTGKPKVQQDGGPVPFDLDQPITLRSLSNQPDLARRVDALGFGFLQDALNIRGAQSSAELKLKGEKPLVIKDFWFSPVLEEDSSSDSEEESIVSNKHSKLVLKKDRKSKFDFHRLSAEEWAAANFRVLKHLLSVQEVEDDVIKDYVNYSIYICDYLQVFQRSNVYKFDDKHRKNVAKDSLNKKWLDIDPHLDRLYLHTKSNPKKDYQAGEGGKGKSKRGGRVVDASGHDICKKFNSKLGCDLEGCKFFHVCSVRNCNSSRHTRLTHNENVPPRFAVKED